MTTTTTHRPPVVAIMGHIDHGKSTLLDYIRKANVVAGEAGGITQHLSAYEISIPYQGEQRAITFLDTPGHAAFSGMRERGASAADIAILVVSAEDGVKAQTIEALNTIRTSGIPFIVAINKIDRPAANIERTKQTLAENEVLVEGYGGNISWVAISAKEGTGIPDLLDTILLVAEMEGINGSADGEVQGTVIESHLDAKRGVAATIVIKSGTLTKGQFVVAGRAITTTRMMENFLGKSIDTVPPGTPVLLVGFDQSPEVGTPIKVFDKKRDAEDYVKELGSALFEDLCAVGPGDVVVPVIIKTDVYGTAEAVEGELKKLAVEGLCVKIINKGVGSISEGDIRQASADKDALILGFNVNMDARAREANEQAHVKVETFTVIYKLTEWLATELEVRRPRKEIREIIGTAKVLKFFSRTKERQVIGARIESGLIKSGAKVTIMRRDFPLAVGTIIELQQAKTHVKELADGECGMMVECKNDIAPGDILEAFTFVTK